MTEYHHSEPGEAVKLYSLLTAVRSSGLEEREGARFRRQRLFWLLFWSQKSDKWLFIKILSLATK
jgi:hypothetical protein